MKVNDNDQYFKRVLSGVYYYGTDSVNISGKGVVESGNIKYYYWWRKSRRLCQL